MTGSRNRIKSVEEKEEVQGEMVHLDEEARMKCERELLDQCRSRFAMVRRRLDNEKKFTRWFAEMRKPKEFGGRLIQIRYDTDVEAAVAASVISGVIERGLGTIRGHKDPDRRKGSTPPLKCHDYLIGRREAELRLQNSPLPDCSDNKSIKEFVDRCVEIYNEMVEGVEKNKTMPMPEDKDMADAITLSLKAVHYRQKYKEGEVPPLKQSRPGDNKRKRNVVESELSAGGINRPQ